MNTATKIVDRIQIKTVDPSADSGNSRVLYDVTSKELKTGPAELTLGNLKVFKKPANSNPSQLEVGDMVLGWWSNTKFIQGTYLGGDVEDIASYALTQELDYEE